MCCIKQGILLNSADHRLTWMWWSEHSLGCSDLILFFKCTNSRGEGPRGNQENFCRHVDAGAEPLSWDSAVGDGGRREFSRQRDSMCQNLESGNGAHSGNHGLSQAGTQGGILSRAGPASKELLWSWVLLLTGRSLVSHLIPELLTPQI